MLLNDFFYIKKIKSEGSFLNGALLINKEHKIFEGHFPSIPIVPGVCMMQMVKEIMEHHLGRKVLLRSGDNVKFLSVINPREHSEIEMAIQYEESHDGIKLNASLFAGATIFFKLKAVIQSV
jgi:3-hydroxyacyl-[acyl-carrier-protein] dehydratase